MPITQFITLILACLALFLLLTLLYVSIRYKEELLSEKAFERFNENLHIFKMGVYVGISLYILFLLEHGVEAVRVFSPLPILEGVEEVFHLLFPPSLTLGVVIALYIIRVLRREG